MKKQTLQEPLIIGFFLSTSIPDKASAVKNFDTERYLGQWYEIARLDYYWEKNLDNVTATYSLKNDGNIKVDNKGYDYKHNKWKESVGKAKPVGHLHDGKLKVSFFGPFYAGYNIVAIDKDYKYALVAGENTDYMWILSRTKTIPDDVRKNYIDQARKIGYKTEDLIWTKQDR